MINIHASYFSIGNPFEYFDRWINPPRFVQTVSLRGYPLRVEWTRRAQRALDNRTQSLLVEMQLYFSCVVKKRVLFHDTEYAEAAQVTDKLAVSFRPVESNSCDPIEFAKSFPVKQEFESAGAQKMRPKQLLVDYKGGKWIGEYRV